MPQSGLLNKISRYPDKEGQSMKRTIIILVFTLLMAIIPAVGAAACNVGGTNIKLQSVSLGTVTMGGQPFQGLPSDKVDILLEVSARDISINYATNGTVINLNDSGSALEITPGGVVIKGMKPEQVKVEWSAGK